MHILILHNKTLSDERNDDLDVLTQRDAVQAALLRLGHSVQTLGCGLDLQTVAIELQRIQPDLVFNLVESLDGKDRWMAMATMLLDGLGIPYTGVDSTTLWNTGNKLRGKTLLRAAGLPTPDWYAPGTRALNGSDSREVTGCAPGETSKIAPGAGATALCNRRWILKPVWEHASVGMSDTSVVSCSNDEGEFPATNGLDSAAGRTRASTYDGVLAHEIRSRQTSTGHEHFAEEYIPGREFNLSLLARRPTSHAEWSTRDRISGPEVLPAAEMRFMNFPESKPRILGYQAKWDESSFEYQNTERCFDFTPTDKPLLWTLRELAIRCWDCFEIRGFARVDFRVDESGQPWILEVNCNPCLSPDAGFAAAVHRAGLGFEDAVSRIIADAPLACKPIPTFRPQGGPIPVADQVYQVLTSGNLIPGPS
jgi:D-alanine-D-alanine ligase